MASRRTRAVAAIVIAALAFPATASAFQFAPARAASSTPKGFRLSGRQAIAIAARTATVRKLAREDGPLSARTAVPLGTTTWQVGFFHGKTEVARTRIDGVTGRRLEPVWTGAQVLWPQVRGIRTPWRDRTDVAMVALGAAFLVPFVGRRRPRMLQLDLLAFVAFLPSSLLLAYGHPYLSVPLQYVPLVYLLARLLYIGFRGREAQASALPRGSDRLLAIGVVVLVTARIAFNLAGAPVEDVGYAGLFGADGIRTGYPLYGDWATHPDAYGPLTYLVYVPFEAAWPLDRAWSQAHVDGARAAAIVFDLVVLILLMLLGRRLRDGKAGRRLGLILAYAWAACPFAFAPLALSSNDALVPIAVLGALLLYRSPAWRGGALGLGAAAKFAPLGLVPLFARGRERSLRSALVCAATAAGIFSLFFLPYVHDTSLNTVWTRTLGYQMHRHSPFTLWGLHPSLAWVHVVVEAVAIAIVVAGVFLPRERTVLRIAALSAATILALQMAGTYWAHSYIAWFAAPAFVAIFGRYAGEPTRRPVRSAASSTVSGK